MSRDWTQLNSDLLHLILKKLENFSNFIRLRGVCKEWRSAVGPTENSSHLPWILYPMNGSDQTNHCIYSLSSNTTRQIKLPTDHIYMGFIHSFNDVESTNGCLLLKHNVSEIPYLFNPITESEIYPPFSKDDSFCFILYMSHHPSGVRLVLCELSDDKLQLGLWKSDNNEFTNFRLPLTSRQVAYYKGKLFVYYCRESKTRIFDMNTGAEIGIGIPDTVVYQCIRYLLVAVGDLLMVEMKPVDDHPYKFQFNVYRLEHSYNFEQCIWIELKGIGDRILFIGWYHCSINAFCLSTSDVNGLKGNCIYYLYNYLVLRYNMEDGTTDQISRIPAMSAKWFMPSLTRFRPA